MIRIDRSLTPQDLRRPIRRMWDVSARKIQAIQRRWNPDKGAPVFTVAGRYTSRGWTEWTQGFQFGSALLQFAATGDTEALAIGRDGTHRYMASHVSHVGVHDHGFNNISTYGLLRQLAVAGRFAADGGEIAGCELALKVSGAVQAARWTDLPDGLGYIQEIAVDEDCPAGPRFVREIRQPAPVCDRSRQTSPRAGCRDMHS